MRATIAAVAVLALAGCGATMDWRETGRAWAESACAASPNCVPYPAETGATPVDLGRRN